MLCTVHLHESVLMCSTVGFSSAAGSREGSIFIYAKTVVGAKQMIRLQPKYPKVSSTKQILFNLQDDILCSCCTAPVLLSLSSLLSPSSPSPPSATYGPKRSVNLEVFVAPANTDFSCYRKLFRHLLCFIFPS